jgi:hypothetical protein
MPNYIEEDNNLVFDPELWLTATAQRILVNAYF